VEAFQPQALTQEIELTLHAPAVLPTVTGDEQRLGQVLVNLLGNALRHTPAGGAVKVQLCSEGGAVQVAVIDDGEGIPAEDLPLIFQRLYRSDRSRSRQTGGSGLGLAIARQLVEAHGGRIWVESPPAEQDRGSAFYFAITSR
jgi:signal transduction histidine kinase